MVLLTAVIVVLAQSALADDPAANTADPLNPKIVNGVESSGHPTTGLILEGNNPDTAQTWCSGTLIGCETFLTAAHCVCDFGGGVCQPGQAFAPDPANFHVLVDGAGIFDMTSIAVHPSFRFPVADVAVMKLAQPVTGIVPTPINEGGKPPLGSTGEIAGYGRTGGTANSDYGIKRAGLVEIDDCPFLIRDATSVCWRFSDPLGPPGDDSSTCNADSGGPLFVDLGAGEVVAGITSGGFSASCFPPDRSFDVDVYAYRAYIKAVSGLDITSTSCGDVTQLGESGTDSDEFSGTLSDGLPAQTHSFEVPAGRSELRVVMNGVDDGVADFNLYVKQGSPPTLVDNDCVEAGNGQFAACEFSDPTAGSWYATLLRTTGGGRYQLQATSVSSDPKPTDLLVDLDAVPDTVPPGGSLDFESTVSNPTPRQAVGWLLVLARMPSGEWRTVQSATPVVVDSLDSETPNASFSLLPTDQVGDGLVVALILEAGKGVTAWAISAWHIES
jgi:hypothetical protein